MSNRELPTRAISKAGHRTAPRAGDRSVTAFLCENSTWKTYSEIALDPALDGVNVVKVPCAGRMDTALLLSLIERGSAGLLVTGCPKDGCTYLRGSAMAERRVKSARVALREAGMDENLVRMEFLSPLDSFSLRETILKFARYLNDHRGP